jgi:hypothetical protein
VFPLTHVLDAGNGRYDAGENFEMEKADESQSVGLMLNGAGDGIRTRDINLGKVALYQLSYSRSKKG